VERIGNYRIDGELGRDSTGVVLEARHLVLPRRAIVKVIDRGDVSRPHAVQLLREACILEALEHPGVVRVYESGLLPDRRPWFARERIDGATVGDLIAGGTLEPFNAVSMLRDVIEIIEHAHRRGVVHCDLRPDRIVITGRTRGYPLCIRDWSDARVHDTSAALPVLQMRSYAAPELLDGIGVDDRADVYSLGAITYQALTGSLPRRGNLVPTEVRCPEAPPALTALIDSMIADERFDRPSAAEVSAELAHLANDAVEAAVAVAQGSGAGIRIRQPRWTPELPLDNGDADMIVVDLVDEVSEKLP